MREVEPLDVVQGYILPQLTQAAAHCRQQQQASTPAAAHAAAAAASAPASTGNEDSSVAEPLPRHEQQHLMRLLAFPVAAGLLDLELGIAGTWQQQQPAGHQRPASATWDSQGRGTARGSAASRPTSAHTSHFDSSSGPAVHGMPNSGPRPGTLLAQLAQVAVLVTSTGHAALAPSCASSKGCSSAAATGTAASGKDTAEAVAELYLPKQLGNTLDLPQLFPAHPWVLISADYASCCATISMQQWSLLLQELGVQTFLPVLQQTLDLTWKQLMMEQRYTAWRDAVERMDDSVKYSFNDWHWRGLQRLLSSIEADTDAVRRTRQYRNLSSVVAGQWQALQSSGQLQCSYSVRSVDPSAAKPEKASAAANSEEAGPTKQRRKKAAEAEDVAGSNKAKLLSVGAASWQPGKQRLPSSVLLGLQAWSWVLASDGLAHPPSDLFARQQVSIFTGC